MTKPKMMEPDQLDQLSTEINDLIDGDLPTLVDYLKTHHKLKVSAKKGSDAVTVTMGGIKGEAREGGVRMALINWGNAARRHLAQAA